jgi:WS/DGAT/MGAT family acyltransferase
MKKTAGLPKRLSSQDAAFWHFERDTMPMNVGSTGIYDGTVHFRNFLEHVERRIDLVPRYRQRLMDVPLDLALPVWIDDPHFDIHAHVTRARIPAPGGMDQLRQMSAEFFAEPLPRDRPLWEMRLVEGLSGGRTAHMAKVHHCMVDGISGVSLLAALLDLDPRAPAGRRRPRKLPPPLPTSAELVADAVLDNIDERLDRSDALLTALLDPLAPLRATQSIVRALGAAARYLAQPAPPLPWSMKLNGPTRLAWQSLPFHEVRAVAKQLGGTINETVLTALSIALGRYLHDGGTATADLLVRAALPVNVRGDGEGGGLGNRVSFMLVGMPVGEADPLKQFAAIHEESTTLKEAGQAAGIDQLMRTIGGGPAPLTAALGRWLTSPNTLSHMVCTNVPGPLVPLYLMGHRMAEHYPWVPLGWRMGMSVAVMSYDTALGFGFSVDRDAPGDVERLAGLLRDAFDDLRDAAGLRPAEPAPPPELTRAVPPAPPAARPLAVARTMRAARPRRRQPARA